MVLADWAYHTYMQVFAPSVRSLSYVDNLACVAHSPASLAHACNLVQCFMDLLRLQLDNSKTFVWATQPACRKAITSFGFPVVEAARELGGVLSFGARVRNAVVKDSCTALAPVWKAMRKSRAPGCLKLLALPAKCWAKALCGCSGAPLAEATIHRLRTTATAALGIRPGGSSSLLRLSLSHPMTADPGFYELWTCVSEIRRMAGKVHNFLLLWQQFSAGFDGARLHGPFTKLGLVLAKVGWSIPQPPLLLDHEGLMHHFLLIPRALLRRLLEHAWLQHVARSHLHRKTMADLAGLDVAVLRADSSRLSALDGAREAAIRSGAFLFGHQHSYYDLSQSGDCPTCGVPDTVEHRICHCVNYAEARRAHQWVCDLWPNLPAALTHHLLPAANPHLPRLRQLLQGIVDTTGVFFGSGFGHGWQHLFTDGSCVDHDHLDFALAGWGLIHAQTNKALACGALPGIHQTAPRAEITAMTAAARWALQHDLPCFVWCDAQAVCDDVHLLQDGGDPSGFADADLWRTLAALLEQLPASRFQVRHTPSHMDQRLTDSPLEDWLAQHNAHADLLAGLCNRNRPALLTEVHAAALRYHRRTLDIVRALRSIFFAVAGHAAPYLGPGPDPQTEDAEALVPSPGSLPRRLDLEEALPLNWRSLLESVQCGLPQSFLQQLCDFLVSLDTEAEEAYALSWLEFVFLLHQKGSYPYPVCDNHGKWLDPSALVFSPPEHTVAVRLSLVRRAMRPALRCLGLERICISGIDLSDLGVRFALDGVVLGVRNAQLLRARAHAGHFVQGRATATKQILARPL